MDTKNKPGALVKKKKDSKNHGAKIGVIQQPAAKNLGIEHKHGQKHEITSFLN